ncbi:hypothetical protein P7D85_14465 [Enterococcus hulanensis]|uniref:30S ribosomal protein S21 n=1 Tax=Enterococcus hulanensis TaxID=2559929 RepID=A0ABU3F1J3_9ENTE|nr:hypothetical protein [Enterococcus hulanensis]MDT2600987.1 hypothetical protein [Enterococcus hulanensis]MDT2610531.1 hypothetical protein [Enterococcus hulanensis]MDT2617258.1 hypothetical protein [Enterococcus hulanensis]
MALREIDKQEQQAILLFNNRYVSNAKKPKLSKVFDKKKAEKRIRDLFSRTNQTTEKQQRAKQVKIVTDYFKNKNWR